MKKKTVLVIGIITAILVVGYFSKFKIGSDTFTLHLVTDGTSSGASRTTTFDLHYQDSILVEARSTYEYGSSTYEGIIECIYTNKKWTLTKFEETPPRVPSEDRTQTCRSLDQYLTTTEEVTAQIENKQILPAGPGCGHGHTCYTIKR